jgi:transposase
MPEADEVVAAYRQTGSTTAVAEHYGVPRHTATGWVRRLRRLGLLETPRRR